MTKGAGSLLAKNAIFCNLASTLECLIAGLTIYLFLKIFPTRKLLLGTLRLLNFQIFGKNLGF